MNSTALPLRRCAHCATKTSEPLAWRCDCGGPFEYEWTPRFNPNLIQHSVWSLWRYREMLLPPGVATTGISLGEGMTPLTTVIWDGIPLTFKLDYLMPTGSYKDRGNATLLSILLACGHTTLVEDSSGNAGASVAAYASATGIDATIFVPAYTASGKKSQITSFGATLKEIEGPRRATSLACHRAAQSTIYASHAWHPAFMLGQMSAAWELWEQLRGDLPDAMIMPAGQGGMLLGYYRGFQALQEAGLIDRMPRLIAVQAEACAPIVSAWELGKDKISPAQEKDTIAAGIRTSAPARGRELLHALRDSNGLALTVDDDAIRAAQQRLARHGLFVEYTSAVPIAALNRAREWLRHPDIEGKEVKIVVPLSGSGLKEN